MGGEPRFNREEVELPDTTCVRDIDNRVFQSIVLQCLSQVEGIELSEGGIIDHLLGRGGGERIRGIQVDQDNKNHSVSIKIEVSIAYGLPIPGKADEIQQLVIREIARLTGLHVSSVHVLFKSLSLSSPTKEKPLPLPETQIAT